MLLLPLPFPKGCGWLGLTHISASKPDNEGRSKRLPSSKRLPTATSPASCHIDGYNECQQAQMIMTTTALVTGSNAHYQSRGRRGKVMRIDEGRPR